MVVRSLLFAAAEATPLPTPGPEWTPSPEWTPFPSPTPVPVDPVAGFACCGSVLFVMLAIVALNIALLVWVARDAKARGMDGAVLWMLLVFFTSLIGLVIYLLSRPTGPLMRCARCGNSRLVASKVCPHCGNE
jgi:hypothetical protein